MQNPGEFRRSAGDLAARLWVCESRRLDSTVDVGRTLRSTARACGTAARHTSMRCDASFTSSHTCPCVEFSGKRSPRKGAAYNRRAGTLTMGWSSCELHPLSAVDPTLDNLDENTLQAFFGWAARSRAAPTVNGCRRELLALWRFAWKKRLLDELPRDVPKLKELKRVPKAWTLGDEGRAA